MGLSESFSVPAKGVAQSRLKELETDSSEKLSDVSRTRRQPQGPGVPAREQVFSASKLCLKIRALCGRKHGGESSAPVN